MACTIRAFVWLRLTLGVGPLEAKSGGYLNMCQVSVNDS